LMPVDAGAPLGLQCALPCQRPMPTMVEPPHFRRPGTLITFREWCNDASAFTHRRGFSSMPGRQRPYSHRMRSGPNLNKKNRQRLPCGTGVEFEER
jgi:hypothetical protein